MNSYKFIKVPEYGDKITVNLNGKLNISNSPIICFIEGDGIGPEITKASMLMWNSAIERAYNGERRISWVVECM